MRGPFATRWILIVAPLVLACGGSASPTDAADLPDAATPVCGGPLSAPFALPAFDWAQDNMQDLKCAMHAFDSVVSDARIVCSGESTHGIAESWRIHAALARHAILDLGFRGIAIELVSADVDAFNAFVEGGDEADLTKGFAETRGTLANALEQEQFYRELRNVRLELPADQHLTLSGIDIAVQTKTTLGALLAYMTEVQPDEAPNWETRLTQGSYADKAAAAAELVAELDANQDVYLAASSSAQWQRAKRDALNLEDGLNFLVFYTDNDFATGNATYREPGLLRNLEAVIAASTNRVLLVAHAQHCAKDYVIGQKEDLSDSPSVGTAFATAHPGTYSVIAQLYAEGSERQLNQAAPAEFTADGIERSLAEIAPGDQYAIATSSTAYDFTQPDYFRIWEDEEVPARQFDGLIWLRRVTPSHKR